MLKSFTRNRAGFAFKRDLEFRLRCYISNAIRVKIKPKKALPWYGAEMQVALSQILKY